MSQAASPSAVLASERPLGAIKLSAADPSLAQRIFPILAAGRSAVLVTTAGARAPAALRAPPANLGERRFVVIRLDGTAELDFAAVLASCCGALDLTPAAERAAAHRAVVARLLRQARDTVSTILLIENAGAVRDAVLEETFRLFSLDDRCLLPTVLVATPDFLERLKAPTLGFLREAIAAHVSLADEDEKPSRVAPAPARPATDRPATDRPATDRSADAVAALEALARRIAEHPSGTPRAAIARPAEPDRGGAAPLAALAQQASQLLKDLDTDAPPPVAAGEAPRPVRRPPILVRRRNPPAGEVPAAPPAVPPPPATPSLAVRPMVRVAPRWRLGPWVAIATYLVVSIAVGGTLVQAWRINALPVPAAWLEDSGVWLQLARTAIVGAPSVAERDEPTLALAALSPQAGPTAGTSQGSPPSEPAEAAPHELAGPAPTEIAGSALPDSAPIEATPATVTDATPAIVPIPGLAMAALPPIEAAPAPLTAPAVPVNAPPVAAEPPVVVVAALPPAEAAPAPVAAPAGPANAPPVAAEPPVVVAAALPPAETAPAPVAAPADPANAPPVAAEPPVVVAALPPAETAPAPVAAPAGPVNAPPAAPDVAAAPPASAPAPIEQLLARGDQLLLTGDIAAARLFYEPAAVAGDPRAALALGKTYDPLYLARIGARGIVADRAKAMSWYRKAEATGNAEARQRLGALIDRSPRQDARTQ